MRALIWPWLFLMIGCSPPKRVSYEDAVVKFASYEDLIETAPLIVFGMVEKKWKSGPPGEFPRRGDIPAFPAQRYEFTLRVKGVLRGDVGGSILISVFGYEDQAAVLTGPPKGVCDVPGRSGVYFLRKEQGRLRTMVDNYRSYLDVPDKATLDLQGVPDSDIHLTLWRLLTGPLDSSMGNVSPEDLSHYASGAGNLGSRTKLIEELSELARSAKNPKLRIAACFCLNEDHGGLGGEQCLLDILGSGKAKEDSALFARAKEQLARVRQHNEEVLRDLQDSDERWIAHWVYPETAVSEPNRLLRRLAKHPDSRIAEAALRRQRQVPR